MEVLKGVSEEDSLSRSRVAMFGVPCVCPALDLGVRGEWEGGRRS
jgi:hypothetical protein